MDRPSRYYTAVYIGRDALDPGLVTIGAGRYILVASLLARLAPDAGCDIGSPYIRPAARMGRLAHLTGLGHRRRTEDGAKVFCVWMMMPFPLEGGDPSRLDVQSCRANRLWGH